MNVGAILLAAGGSTRMGSPKQLLPYSGGTLLRRAVERALASVCRPVYVVLGAGAMSVNASIADLPVGFVENAQWAQGIGTSIRCGLAAVVNEQPHVDAVAILLADQPYVTTHAIDSLVASAEGSAAPIVASAYGGSVGVPALFRSEMFSALSDLGVGEGAKRVIAANAGRVLALPLPEAAVDIDTPDDYAVLRGMKQPEGEGRYAS